MGKVYSSDVVQLEKEVTQVYIINMLYSEHCARSPHKAAEAQYCNKQTQMLLKEIKLLSSLVKP